MERTTAAPTVRFRTSKANSDCFFLSLSLYFGAKLCSDHGAYPARQGEYVAGVGHR